jgi:predicted kinase
MANLVGLCGLSNSGKSTSLKYLDPGSTFIISCTNKQLQIPGFRKKYQKIKVENNKLVGNWLVSNDYAQIQKMLKIISTTRPDIKTLVIDDANYLLSNATFKDALVKG